MNGNHDFTVESRVETAFVNAPMRYRAQCACGWVCTEWRRKKRDAVSDGLQHQGWAGTELPPQEAA